MKIDHVRFYVTDASATRDWFIQRLGFQSVAGGASEQSQVEIVRSGNIFFVLCSALTGDSPVAEYLRQHPAGVADLAFEVEDVATIVTHAVQQGASLRHQLQTESQPQGELTWATIAAWGDVTHTFLQRSGQTSLLPLAIVPEPLNCLRSVSTVDGNFSAIDHVVLNVAAGDLESAVTWYEKVLGLQARQKFEIQTEYSGLCSRVMSHAGGQVQLPINEPMSPTSQIQEFLNANRGAGIQHIALETVNLVTTIAQLRQTGLPLLQVPATYYDQLRQRSGLCLSEAAIAAIAAEQILVDWQDQGEDCDRAVLLQTFTQPIFAEPTFFFELIERQPNLDGQLKRAQGFGEGNFRALFEAIEREQIRRGSLLAN
jgi:4-hydroxyphenylpyruvate dioxygenase